MAFYNSLGDLWGDIQSIAGGHNPSNRNVFTTQRAPGFQPPPSLNGLPTNTPTSALNLGPLGNSFENPGNPLLNGTGGLNGLDTSNPGAAILSAANQAARPTVAVAGPGDVNVPDAGTAPPGNNSQGILGSIGDFIEKHPNAVAMGLQGLGSLATIGADRRLKSAQASALEGQAGLTANELEQRKKEQAALAPYFAQTAAATTGRRSPVARNPYLPPQSGNAGVTGG